MKIEEKSALLVIDIQQEDFKEMDENNMEAPEWNCIRNAKKVLDIFRAKKLPVIQIKEVHRPDMVDFGRELDGAEGIRCIETSPYTDYAKLTYPIEGEYLISKRRYSAFFGTDLEILLRGLQVDTLYLIGGLTDVCMENAGTILEQKKTRTIKYSRINRRVLAGVTGINQESRSIGVGEVLFIQSASVSTMLNILAAL